MLSINNISNGLYFGGKSHKSVSEKPVCDRAIVEFSKSASDSIANTQRGLMMVNRIVPLDKTSEYSKYFGVDSAENIQNQLLNHSCLSFLKMVEQNIVNFPIFNIDDAGDIDYAKQKIQKYTNKLSENGAGRWTFYSKFYGKDGKSGTHTVGIIKHNDKTYILDSLSGAYPEIEKHHEILTDILGEDVVFSTKQQQKLDEYTCNNWTHANIDAVLQTIDEGVFDGERLDGILPNNINKILREQKEFIVNSLNGRDILEIVAEEKRKNKV